MRYCVVGIVLVTFLVGCDNLFIEKTENGGEIMFNTGIVETRGAIDSDDNDIPRQAMNNIQVVRGVDGATVQGFSTAGIASVANITAGSNTMTLATPQYFVEFGDNAHFVAFYPEHDTYMPGKVSWVIDGTKDIMVTAPVTALYDVHGTSVAFIFTHLLARVQLKVVAADKASADVYGKLLSATIRVPSEVELNIADNGVATLAKKTNSAKSTLDFGEMELNTTGTITEQGIMIYPDAGDLTEITLRFEHREATAFPITSVSLDPGYKTLITATVTAHSVNFDVVTLKGWDPVTETDGQEDEIGLGNPGESLQ